MTSTELVLASRIALALEKIANQAEALVVEAVELRNLIVAGAIKRGEY